MRRRLLSVDSTTTPGRTGQVRRSQLQLCPRVHRLHLLLSPSPLHQLLPLSQRSLSVLLLPVPPPSHRVLLLRSKKPRSIQPRQRTTTSSTNLRASLRYASAARQHHQLLQHQHFLSVHSQHPSLSPPQSGSTLAWAWVPRLCRWARRCRLNRRVCSQPRPPSARAARSPRSPPTSRFCSLSSRRPLASMDSCLRGQERLPRHLRLPHRSFLSRQASQAPPRPCSRSRLASSRKGS